MKLVRNLCIVFLCVLVLAGCDKGKGEEVTADIVAGWVEANMRVKTAEEAKFEREPTKYEIEEDLNFTEGGMVGPRYINMWLGIEYYPVREHLIIPQSEEQLSPLLSINIRTGESMELVFEKISKHSTIDDIKDIIHKDVNKTVFTHLAEAPVYEVEYAEPENITLAGKEFMLLRYKAKNPEVNQAVMYRLDKSHLTMLKIVYLSEDSLREMLRGISEIDYERGLVIEE